MDDVRAVEQVLLDYFDGVDRRDPEVAVSVFARGRPGGDHDRQGARGPRPHRPSARPVLVRYARTSHHFTNARVEIDGDRAVLRTYSTPITA